MLLRAARVAKGFTVSSFAATIGVSKAFWSNVENGRKPLPRGCASEVARLLDLDERELVRGRRRYTREDVRAAFIAGARMGGASPSDRDHEDMIRALELRADQHADGSDVLHFPISSGSCPVTGQYGKPRATQGPNATSKYLKCLVNETSIGYGSFPGWGPLRVP